MVPDVPADWAAAVRRILGGDIRRILVLGSKDAGKSSFCRVLLREAARMGRAAELLDADPGQKIVGPPACATLVRGLSSTPTALAFVGVLDPLRGWHRLVDGSARLVAEVSDHALLVVNTSGLLAGAGRRLKAAKIAVVRPQLLVGLGGDPELDAILTDHTAIPAVRLGRSPSARRKTRGERRALRCAAFHAYLAFAPVWSLDLRGLWQEGEELPAERQLVGLADAMGRDLVLGVALGSRSDAQSLVLRAPRPALPVAGLRWGALRLARVPAEATLGGAECVRPNEPSPSKAV
jgi:polynucleotide 5'-hydroxyl-kinase GRC3/NOL9